MSHYDNFYREECYQNTNLPLAQQLPNEPLPDDTDRRQQDYILKQTAGKAEGARYCFLDCIGGEDRYKLGLLIQELVFGIDNKYNKGVLLGIIDTIKHQLHLNKKIIPSLIKLRYDAITSGKYKEDGYRQKIDINLLLDALARHYIKLQFGETVDIESGCLHESHLYANLCLISYQITVYWGV